MRAVCKMGNGGTTTQERTGEAGRPGTTGGLLGAV